MSKTKQTMRLLKTILILGLLSMLLGTTATAHGPEEHITKNECSAQALAVWETSACDPNNPADISGGIKVSDYPNGLCYPSFNNFLNYVYYDNNTGQIVDQSPYGTNNPPLFEDERNFFTAAIIDPKTLTAKWNQYNDELEIKDGDRLQFLVYIHNDGDPCLNENISKSGKAASYNTTSYGTRLNVDNLINGKTTVETEKTLTASIWSENAINEKGLTGGKTQDAVKLKSKNNEKLELQFIEKSAIFVDMQDLPPKVWFSDDHPINDATPLFNTSGLPLNTHETDEAFKASGGTFYASKPYIALVRFEVKVQKPKPNICTSLELTQPYQLSAEELKKYTGSEKNGPMYKLAVNKFAFEKFPYPAQTKIKFTSTDPKGNFWLVDYFGAISPLNKNNHEAYIDQFLQNAMTNQIFYTGTGTVTATITNIPEDQANPTVCTDSVTFKPPTVEEKVCNEIFIDHPKTIYTDTVSTFKSQSVDQNGDQFESLIEYSVDEGYGLFYTTYPLGYDKNDSETVYEIKGQQYSNVIPLIFSVVNNVILENIDTLGNIGNLQFLSQYGQTSVLRIGDNLILESYNDLTTQPTLDLDAEPTIDQPSVTSADDLTLSIELKPPVSGLDTPTVDDSPFPPPTKTPETTGDKDKEKNTGILGGILGTESAGTLSTTADITVKKKFDPRNVKLEPVFSLNDLEPLFTYPDSKMELLKPKSQTKIVVAQGTTIYFYGLKEGKDVVHVRTINSDAKACKRDFDIVKKKEEIKVCDAIKVNHNTTIFEKKLSKFSAKAMDTKKQNFDGQITYSVTEGYGTFYVVKPANKEENTSTFITEFTGKPTPPQGGKFCADKNTAQVAKSGSTVTVNPGEEVYLWAEKSGKGVITVDTNCSSVTRCSRKFDITEVPKVKVCDSLQIKNKPASLKIGEEINLTVGARDNLGATIPAETGLIWTTDTQGTISFKQTNSQNGTLKLNFSNQPVKFSGSKKAGTIEISLDPKDKFYSPKCKDLIKIREEEKPLVCTDLVTTLIKKYPSNEIALKLTQNEIYTVKGKPTFSKPYPQAEIVYDINPTIGTFIDMGSAGEVIKNVVLTGLKQKLDERLLTAQFVGQFLEEMNRINPEIKKAPVSKIKAKPDETVYFVVYSDANQVGKNTVSASVYGFTNIECTDNFPFEIKLQPKACQSLLIEPVYGKFDPTEKYTILRLTGDFKDHNGIIDINTNCGTVSKTGADSSYTSQNISFYSNEVKNSNNLLTFYYKGDASCVDKDVTLSTKAIGTAAGICEDKLSKFKPGKEIKCVELNIKKPNYPWEPTKFDEQLFLAEIKTSPLGFEGNFDFHWDIVKGDGQWQNNKSQQITGTGINKLSDFDSNTTVEVTALLDGQKVANCADSRKIKKEEEAQIEKVVYPRGKYNKETDLLNIGEKSDELTYKIVYANGSADEVQIQEKAFKDNALQGNLGGELKATGMTIQIHDGSDLYTIFKTSDYIDDGEDDNYEDFNNGKNLQKYEDDFNCKDGDVYKKEKTVCIEGDFNEIKNNFLDGEYIEFQKLKPTTNIVIKVQVDNKSEIVMVKNKCETLKASKGCGESFENEAAFVTKNPADSGKDKAKVIVICPFILAREGGDVFFHDVVETGVDVAKCSKVKSAQGPVITPKPKKGQDIPSTGAGDELKDIVLTLPSHDICKYSNLGSNLEGYNNVLENFSSTICELKAEVAKEWKEANIVKAINDNITRIARFGQNLEGVGTITSFDDLANVENKQSGVFVKEDGDLTIDLGSNLLQASGEIPAAQTYIVKGHDLIIESDIKYYFNALDFIKPKKIPAAAFIVIDGNIIIDNGVTQIDGVLMAVDTDPKDGSDKGKITNKGPTVDPSETSETQLTINGNLIGNVFELFKSRIFVGDPEKDEGSVTIRYDERIMLNTPPGLSELINLNQTIVPN